MVRRLVGRRLVTRVLSAIAGVAVIVVGPPVRARAQLPAPTRCGVGIPSSEASGYVPLPRGDVFCPLLADPKGQRSFVSYLRETDDDGATDLGSVGISDIFGLLRAGEHTLQGQSAFSMAHPGLAAELDHPDVAALIAPRPLLLFGSPQDGLFPWDAVQKSWQDLARGWAGGRGLDTRQTAGGHRFDREQQAAAVAWLKQAGRQG